MNNKALILKIIFFILFGISLVIPDCMRTKIKLSSNVLAQPPPSSSLTSLPTLEIGPTENIPNLAIKIYNWLVRIAGILALLMIVWGGVEYAFFSTASPGRIEDAKERIREAVIGLFIVLLSWLILRFINPQLVNPPP